MPRRTGLRAAAAVVVCGSLVWLAQAQAASTSASAHLTPPLIHERFTALACTGRRAQRTTLQEEGCVEQEILATDAQINAAARAIFSLLPTDTARRRFIAAQTAWLNFRRADCSSVSDVFERGTLAPLIDAQCSAERNGQRVKDLRTFRGELVGNG